MFFYVFMFLCYRNIVGWSRLILSIIKFQKEIISDRRVFIIDVGLRVNRGRILDNYNYTGENEGSLYIKVLGYLQVKYFYFDNSYNMFV